MHKLVAAVEKHGQRMEKALEFFWKNPETGYREWKGHKYLADAFRELGYDLTEAGNIPGFYTDVVTGRPGPLVLVMGELDSLLCDTHPEADPQTGAVHSCGHCCQSAALLGLAAALKEPGVLDDLCGTIRLMAVPAEELIEVEYREKLRRDGVIRYYGGKVEFMYRGFMDGVDVAFMIHTSTCEANTGTVTKGSNGCISKEIIFSGVAAHAGGSPDKGINALYAANLAMNAINALRETFRDDDHIRIHPIVIFEVPFTHLAFLKAYGSIALNRLSVFAFFSRFLFTSVALTNTCTLSRMFCHPEDCLYILRQELFQWLLTSCTML